MERQGKISKFPFVVIVLAGLISGVITMSHVYDKKKIIPYGYFMPKHIILLIICIRMRLIQKPKLR